mgnify:FL=1
MLLNNLLKTTSKKKKRIGRGYGSGKGGHTVGRGQKGQKSRHQPFLLFEGKKTQKSLLRRLPLLRGKDKFKPRQGKAIIINLDQLSGFPAGEKVSLEVLVERGLVEKDEAKRGVKILGRGETKKPLEVTLPCSKGAREKIEKAGGKIYV